MSSGTFHAGNTSALRAAGLTGRHVLGLLHADVLQLHGDERGTLRIAAPDVRRMRVGYTEGRTRFYSVQIERESAPGVLTIVPYPGTWTPYTSVVRGFASAIMALGRTERIEAGSSKFDAMFAPVLFGLLTLGAIAVALFAMGGQPWWGRLLVPLVPAALCWLFLRIGMRRHWPQPIRSLAELDGQLPPTGATSAPATIGVLVGGPPR